MIEQPPGRGQQVPEGLEVLGHPLASHMLEHADRGDGVEGLAAQVAVVHHADLHLPVETGLADPAGRFVDLLPAQGHPDHPGAVVLGGVDGHRTPAAADVEQARSGRPIDAELATDQLAFGGLGILQAGFGGREPGTGVGHGGPEHQPVEVVAHVVVVTDGPGVACRRMEPTGRAAFLGRCRQRRAEHSQPTRRTYQVGQAPESELAEFPRRRVVQGAQQFEDVTLGDQVAGDEGPGDTQLARRPENPSDRVGRTDPQHSRPVLWADGRPVPELEPHRRIGSHHGLNQGGEDRRRAVTGRMVGALDSRSVRRPSEPGDRPVRFGLRPAGPDAGLLGDHDRPPRPGNEPPGRVRS